MDHADPEPGSSPASERDAAQKIQDSFQAILDALDAARAELHAGDGSQGPANPPRSPAQGVPPSTRDRPRAGDARRAPQDAEVWPLWSRGVPGAGHEQPGGTPPVPPPTVGPLRSTPRTPPGVAPPHAAPPHPASGGPPLPQAHRGHRRPAGRRHARIAGIFGLGAVGGLILASSLLTNARSAPAAPPASLERPEQPLPGDTSLPEIPGTGVLREGDSGHGVYELQVRLLQVPQVYDGGAIDGRFGTEVRQAVTRFQKRFGIRGDEAGVYGDNTRYALMLRTK